LRGNHSEVDKLMSLIRKGDDVSLAVLEKMKTAPWKARPPNDRTIINRLRRETTRGRIFPRKRTVYWKCWTTHLRRTTIGQFHTLLYTHSHGDKETYRSGKTLLSPAWRN
jgi:hypothetical protein